MLVTHAQAIISDLAQDYRRVASDWRTMIILRQATAVLPRSQRRWEHAPRDVSEVRPLLRRLARAGHLRPIARLPQLYEVTAPFAPIGVLDADELLMEINPYAALSHQSALAFHMLTDQLPKHFTALTPESSVSTITPIGTIIDDWQGLHRPPARRPSQILSQKVEWIRIPTSLYFGLYEYHPRGYPIRVTDPERTLLDSVQQPQLAGGIANVMRAWALARDTLDVERLVDYTNRFNVGLLRQRVGYVLEALGLHHPCLDAWAIGSKRGGSSKFVAAEPFNSRFSERWNVSLNVPIEVLEDAFS